MKVPVKIIIDDKTKEHRIEIGTPPTSSLIRKELGLKKIAPEKKEEEETETEDEEEKKTEGKEEKLEKEVKKPEEKTEVEEEGKVEGESKPEGKDKETVEEEEPKERVIVGNLTIDQCIKITKMKRDSLLAKDMKKAVKEVVASCVSMPITVEGKNPKEVLKEIDEGKYDSRISD
jgi:ribosomal protein L11